MKKKTIIAVPDLQKPGGVAVLYNTLQLWNRTITHFQVQGKWHEAFLPVRIFEIITLYLKFAAKLILVDSVIINPSLNPKSFMRDAVFVFLAKCLRKKTIVFWHGWRASFYQRIVNTKSLRAIYSATYLRADRTIVLSSRVRDELQAICHNGPISIETNTADISFLANEQKKKSTPSIKDKPFILFMARIVREKGVFIAIDAFLSISDNFEVDLVIAGTGPDLMEAQSVVPESLSSRVHFIGHVSAEQKHEVLSGALICLFPTYYGEGMPLTVIEALAYGKPLITRPEGGILDWIVHEKHAILEESKNPRNFADWLSGLLADSKFSEQMGNSAKELFEVSFHPNVMKKRMLRYLENNPSSRA